MVLAECSIIVVILSRRSICYTTQVSYVRGSTARTKPRVLEPRCKSEDERQMTLIELYPVIPSLSGTDVSTCQNTEQEKIG